MGKTRMMGTAVQGRPTKPKDAGRASRASGGPAHLAAGLAVVLASFALLASGCVSPAEHRKLENRVTDLSRQRQGTGSNAQAAETTAELQSLRAEVAELRGRVDIAERQAAEALSQAGRARREIAAAGGTQLESESSGSRGEGGSQSEEADPLAGEGGSAELSSYRTAYAAWRSEDYDGCIDQFRKFLQTYPASGYADDAAYWMADCHFKQEDYRNAVLRFDDVVRNYPTGNKAPDALYRQGESLLKLGPGFHEAARRAFERVLKEYPESPAAGQAREQLKAMGAR